VCSLTFAFAPPGSNLAHIRWRLARRRSGPPFWGVWRAVVAGSALGHNGGGFGFQTIMEWRPGHGVGAVALTNSADHPAVHSGIVRSLLSQICDLIPKDTTSASADEIFAIWAAPNAIDVLPATPYQSAWSSYLGTYRPAFGGGFHLAPTAPASRYEVRLYERDAFLWLSQPGHERLTEHAPGLFFGTITGEAVDLRNPVPRCRNIPLRKAT
jgi:hypothetical protein